MAYSKHTLELNDTECLIILNALSMLIKNDEKHQIDKDIASKLWLDIMDIVKADKGGKNE